MNLLILIIITTTKFNIDTTIIKQEFKSEALCEQASSEITSMLDKETYSWKYKCIGKTNV